MYRAIIVWALRVLCISPAMLTADGAAFGQVANGYAELKAQAEAFFLEGSFQRAHELYARAEALELSPADTRWVRFRLADTLWRAQAATKTADDTKYQEAERALEALVAAVPRPEDRDLVWAEAQQSLGDLAARDDEYAGYHAWRHYREALDWWSWSQDLAGARQGYLQLVHAAATWRGGGRGARQLGGWSRAVPLDVLENTLRISVEPSDVALANYLLAQGLRGDDDWRQQQRVAEAFENALRPGPGTPWFDDALFGYAEWLAERGPAQPLAEGGYRNQPDYVKALELFRRLLAEFKEGETAYRDQVKQWIDQIAEPAVSIGVETVFLPDSIIQFYAGWRNVPEVTFALYPVTLVEDANFERETWEHGVDTRGRTPLKTWTRASGDQGDYQPGEGTITLDEKLPRGAYVIEISAGGKSARDLILVTDATIVLKTSPGQVLAYVCDSASGAPLPKATVALWEHVEVKEQYLAHKSVMTTDENGLAVIPFGLATDEHSRSLYVAALVDGRQAFATTDGYVPARSDDRWRIYAFTDRPAYRPGDTVHWKLIARREEQETYVTPAHQRIKYVVKDSQRAVVKEETVELNEFGSAWGELPLTGKMPLGAYGITLYAGDDEIGSAYLFRLEEYKLPEFQVSITTPTDEQGRRKAFRVGDTVEVTVQADYYFGGPVGSASVKVRIHQAPFTHCWQPPHEFGWLYDDVRDSGRSRYDEQLVKQEAVTTDATGRAVVRFETPEDAKEDFEYRIEARVTDAARREIAAEQPVRVTRQMYYVDLRPAHNIYRPQDRAQVEIRALDANDKPLQVAGQVEITRQRWVEIWLDPQNNEVTGAELEAAMQAHVVFPPPPKSGERAWQLKFRGYEQDEILTQAANTDAEGRGGLTFTPERDGCYRVAWESPDPGYGPIRGETTVWVATGQTQRTGYHPGGVEIVIDQDTFRTGQTAPLLLTVPGSDRWVLFTVEARGLLSYRLIHVTGNTKVLEVPVTDEFVPNVDFGAVMVSGHQMFSDEKQVIVPPVDHFLTVEVQTDREVYEPRQEGTLTVRTRDQDGRPLAAEVALGLVDESVYYIQQDYARDPREFFFGERRYANVGLAGTLRGTRYRRLVRDEKGKVADQYEAALKARGEGEMSAAVYMLFRAPSAADAWGSRGEAAPLAMEYRPHHYMVDAVRPSFARGGGGVMYGMGGGRVSPPALSPEGVEFLREEAVQVRHDFRVTAFWQADLKTDADGVATVRVTYPESLTGWQATARATSSGSQFGQGTAKTRTRQPLIVRLQTPRFLLVGDTVTVSAVMNNNTDEPLEVLPQLQAEGVKYLGWLPQAGHATGGAMSATSGDPPAITIPARGEQRVDWLVEVAAPGAAEPGASATGPFRQARLKVMGRGRQHADAMERTLPIYPHGLDKLVAKSGKVRGDDVTVKLSIPRERRAETTTLRVQVTPSLAVTMLDALPYLVNYPYGCTEQTMSRFLPAVITAKTLKDLGLEREIVANRLFGGIEQDPENLRQAGPQHLAQLDDVVRQSLQRLYDCQRNDGGWGWWKGLADDPSDHYMTAYVVWGLALARAAGIEVRDQALKRAVDYLDKELVEEERNLDIQAWMLHALAVYNGVAKASPTGFQLTAYANLNKQRNKLNAYTRALLALCAHAFGKTDDAHTLVRNLEDGVELDATPDTSVIQQGAQQSEATVLATAHWGADGVYYRWSESGEEATAFALRALLAIEPDHKLVEPVANWLIKNRRGAQWRSTRDTAIIVLALNDYLRKSGELNAELSYELLVNGQSIAQKHITLQEVFSAPSRFDIDPALIRDGENEVRIRRTGGSNPLYFSAEARFFSLEEPIAPAGNELFVRRWYYRLVEHPTLLKGLVRERQPLSDGDTVVSGERVEAVITLAAKNNLEYLVFEDLKPAGFETVQFRSGEPLWVNELKSGTVARQFGRETTAERTAEEHMRRGPSDYTGRSRWVHQELRDRRVALFVDRLPEGVWEMRYELRAEVPGDFHALPTVGYAMYVPEIRCNGAEIRVQINDARQGD